MQKPLFVGQICRNSKFKRVEEKNQLPTILVIAGIFGNLFDRIIRGHVIDFIDFEYKASWKPGQSESSEMVLKETFTDELTKNVRQNEMTFYMEPLKNTLNMIRQSGFMVKGRTDMSSRGDPYQYYYILERPQSK